ncbi:MAG: DnaD domain protein [Clostridia bacterium]|nr:DnaD domain protein [Clostridia bacterium]
MGVQNAKGQNHTASRRLRILYGDEVTVLPLAAADAAARASGLDCKILWCLAADPAAREGGAEALSAFAERIGHSLDEVECAIAYWRGAGVIDLIPSEGASKRKAGRPRKQTPEEIVSEEKGKRAEAAIERREAMTEEMSAESPSTQEANAARGKKLRKADELPNYTMTELSELLEKRKNLSLFLDECQRAYGKMFNPRDIGKVIGMIDHLALSEEYVLTLLHYFGEMPEEERKTLHYVERMAFSLTDDGITDPSALREHLERLRMLRSNEGQIRTIFGMGARAFTAKEKKAVMLWLGEYGCSMELIRLAYERTVNATGKPSIPYASKILERWYREGLSTPEAVEAAERKSEGIASEENFNTDDFFEAALRRSYGEAYEEIYRNKDKTDQ